MLQEYSLHGEWNFRLDPESVGMKEKWQEQNVTDKIQIPGILQAQGYGEDISETTPCFGFSVRNIKRLPMSLIYRFCASRQSII
jgi:hypothetical protein